VNTWVKNQLRDAWVDSGVHDGRIECSRSPEYAHAPRLLLIYGRQIKKEVLVV
jgi:hypothetical protein